MWSPLHIGLSVAWLLCFWRLTYHRPITTLHIILGMLGAHALVILFSHSIWMSLLHGYPADSFWTLSTIGRLGVIGISSIGITGFFLALAAKTRFMLRRSIQASGALWLPIDVAIGMLCFCVLYSVSPQIYYAFYQLVFPDLPTKWVIDTAFNLPRLQTIANFTGFVAQIG